MATLSVGTSAQAIYPDGLQDAFIIRNNGPWTIYVDSDTSISENTSHAIPPTGVMSWDANRPLFMLCASLAGSGGSSSVIITRNSTPATFTNEIENVLVDQRWNTASFVTSGVLECTGYSVLKVLLEAPQMAIAAGVAVTSANCWSVTFAWYDQAGNVVGRDNVWLPGEWSDGATFGRPFTKAYVPVKGSYFTITAAAGSGAVVTGHLRVIGTTRDIPLGMHPFNTSKLLHSSPGTGLETVASSDSSVIELGGVTVAQRIGLPNISRNLHLNVLSSALAAGAFMILANPLATNVETYRYKATIGMATGATDLDADVVLPLFLPVYLYYLPPNPAPASFNVSLLWT